MKLTISFEMDNAQFEEGPKEEAAETVIEDILMRQEGWMYNGKIIWDINGNKIGQVTVE
jgi:hypothetical protein